MSALNNIEKVFELENKYPIEQWNIAGIDIWPILRSSIGHALYKESLGEAPRKSSKIQNLRRRYTTQHLKTLNVIKLVKGIATLIYLRRSIRKYDTLISTHSKLNTKLGIYSYNRIADSFEIILKRKYGNRVLILNANIEKKEINSYNEKNKILINNLSFLASTISKVRFHFKNTTTHLSHFEEFCKEPLIADFKININTLIQTALYIKTLSGIYSSILKSNNVKGVYCTVYYEHFNFAIIHAANALGIPTYDIQHGVAGNAHMNYGLKRRIPQNGFNILPSSFLCWDEASYNTIRNWSNNNYTPIISGNPWIDLWSDNTIPKLFNLELPNDFNRVITHSFVILFSLQNTKKSIPEEFVNLLREELGCTVLFRLHPSQNNIIELTEFLDSQGLKNKVFIKEPTQIPLNLILPKIDLHITLFSSVALEAAYFNKPTLFLDHKGLDFFEKNIPSHLLFCKKGDLKEDLTTLIYKLQEERR